MLWILLTIVSTLHSSQFSFESEKNTICFLIFYSTFSQKTSHAENFTSQLLASQFELKIYLSGYIFLFTFSIKKVILHEIQTIKPEIWNHLRIQENGIFSNFSSELSNIRFSSWGEKISFFRIDIIKGLVKKKKTTFIIFKMLYNDAKRISCVKI